MYLISPKREKCGLIELDLFLEAVERCIKMVHKRVEPVPISC